MPTQIGKNMSLTDNYGQRASGLRFSQPTGIENTRILGHLDPMVGMTTSLFCGAPMFSNNGGEVVLDYGT